MDRWLFQFKSQGERKYNDIYNLFWSAVEVLKNKQFFDFKSTSLMDIMNCNSDVLLGNILYYALAQQPEGAKFHLWDRNFINKLDKVCSKLCKEYHPDKHVEYRNIEYEKNPCYFLTTHINRVKEILKMCCQSMPKLTTHSSLTLSTTTTAKTVTVTLSNRESVVKSETNSEVEVDANTKTKLENNLLRNSKKRKIDQVL